MKLKYLIIFIAIIIFSIPCIVNSQDSNQIKQKDSSKVGLPTPQNQDFNSPPAKNGKDQSLWQQREFMMTLIILIFGVLVLCFLLLGKKSLGANEYVLVALVLIVIASLVAIVAGYSQKQIAPAFGLFGTIVGFLLGNGTNSFNKPSNERISSKKG